MSNGHGRATRLIAGGVLGLTALSFAPSSAGAAISTAAFCAGVTSGSSGFTDLALAGVHANNVECLKASGVTAGTSATTYSPQQNVSRAQMATFIANMIDRANALDAPGGTAIPDLPTAAASTDRFTDDETSIHENNINRLAQAGIISGTSATTFSPNANVSRAQMASFIAQALAFIRGGALPEGADAFTDDETSEHEANINRLATADIVDGVGGGLYNPSGLVSRAQMASFIVQAMADLHADGFINAVPGGSNQSLQVTGGTETRQANGTDSRTCTVTSPAGSVLDLRLFPSADVIIGQNGQVTFLDAGGDSLADENAAGAVIAAVNGAPIGTQEVNGAAGGTTQVTLVGGAAADVTLVAWVDNPGLTANALDLTVAANSNPKTPREAFGIGCRTVFANEAASGTVGVGGNAVTSTAKDSDLFNLSDGFTYFYDSGDTFQAGTALVCATGLGATQLTMAQFESMLSPGDAVDGNYSPDPTLVSRFCITDSSPVNPDSVTITPLGTSTRIVIDDADTTTADAYNVYRVIRPVAGTCPDFQTAGATGRGAYTLISTQADPSPSAENDALDITFNDTGLTQNTNYCYAVTTVDDGDESTGTNEQDINTGSTADAQAPTIVDARLQTDTGLLNVVNTGDVIRLDFSEALDPATATLAGNQLVLNDGDDTYTITAGTDSTWVLGADGAGQANRRLTITMIAAPTDTNVGGDNLPEIPATIQTASANIRDVSANPVNVAGSADVVVDVEPVAP